MGELEQEIVLKDGWNDVIKVVIGVNCVGWFLAVRRRSEDRWVGDASDEVGEVHATDKWNVLGTRLWPRQQTGQQQQMTFLV